MRGGAQNLPYQPNANGAAFDGQEQQQQRASKEILTLDEAADYTGLSKSTLYKLNSSNEIPHYKPSGGKVYYKLTELINWLTSNRVATSAEIEERAASISAQLNKKGGMK